MQKSKRVKVKKKRKINYKKILIFFLICYILINLINIIVSTPIKNIYVYNNNFLTDQKIIELAGIDNYPSAIKTFSFSLEKKLLKNNYIKDVKVYKKNFTEIHIEITENYPLFYNKVNDKVVYLDKKELKDKVEVPTLINYIPDTIYNQFIDKMATINIQLLNRISEIQYDPNEVDANRFLFYMKDGNYVYLTLTKFTNINDYINIMEKIISKFGNQKGILNLDSGGYFDVFEEQILSN